MRVQTALFAFTLLLLLMVGGGHAPDQHGPPPGLHAQHTTDASRAGSSP